MEEENVHTQRFAAATRARKGKKKIGQSFMIPKLLLYPWYLQEQIKGKYALYCGLFSRTEIVSWFIC
jgi:hypothetical protein